MTSIRNIKNHFLLLVMFVYVVLYFALVVRYIPNYAMAVNGLFISALTFLAYMLNGFQNYSLNKIRKKIIIEIVVAIAVYITVIYFLGYFTGFLKNSYSMEFVSIIKNMIIPLISIVALELFRYIYVSNNSDSIYKVILGTIIIMLFDIVLNYYVFGSSLYDLFIFISVTVVPILFKNALLSYLAYHTGYHSCLVYVIPLSLYKYCVPVLPDLGDYLTCVVNITLPAMIFIYASRMINDFLNEKESMIKPLKVALVDIPLIIVFTMLVTVVSGFFKFHLIGVNTSAISPTVDRGDAVMIFKDIDLDDFEVGDIVALKGKDEYIIDRISNKKVEGNNIKLYVTTEVNEGEEDTYRQLDKDEILGIYRFRIRKVAFPTIWFKDLLRRDKNAS